MRLALIIGLVILCVWLFSERHTLQGQIANVESKLETSRKETAELNARLKTILNETARGQQPTPAEKQSWLQQHIDRGARSLELEPRPVFNGGSRPVTPNSRIIR
jgi:uncharacterized membrane-anchored protein YhcB (DUF1043 family)